MRRIKRTGRFVSFLLALNMLLINLPVHAAFAVMVETEAIQINQDTHSDRERVRSLMDRKEVQSLLSVGGLDPVEAKKRVDSLTDAEVTQIADKIDQLPAGSSAVGTLVYVVLIVVLVLLITELLGYTNIF